MAEKKLLKIGDQLSFREVIALAMAEAGKGKEVGLNFLRADGILSKPLLPKILLQIIASSGGKGKILLQGEPYPEEENIEEGQSPPAIARKSRPLLQRRPPRTGTPSSKSLLRRLVAYRLLIVILVLAILVFSGLTALYYYLPRATISIFVENEILSKGVAMQASPSAQKIEKEKRIIPAQLLAFSSSGEKTISTTGKKEVGDKAEGVVTIYNKTDQEKTFPAGTSLFKIDPEGESLRYQTAEEVTVPPRKAEISAEVVSYISGKNDVKVVAEKIGEEYNLAEGEELSLESYSPNTYIARTNQGISGGSSRVINTVTERDMEKALEELRNELLAKARQSVEARVKENQYFDAEALYLAKETRNYNHQAGEEASEISVESKTTYKLITFYKSDVKSLMNMLVEEFIPENFSLSADRQDIGIADVHLTGEGEDTSLSFTAKFRGMVVPELNKEDLARNLSGKTLAVAEQAIQELPKKTGFEIKLSPSFLPKFLQRLPFREKNIRVEVKSE